MKQLGLALKTALIWIGAAVFATAGDLTMSTSNNPATAFEGTFGDMLAVEHMAMSNVTSADIERLTRSPKRSKGVDVYSREYLAGLPKARGGDQWYCLAEALYFEARGEDVVGQFAVAEVIMNRVDSSRFPNSICKVVNQGTGQKFRCQFTYTCDGRAEHINEQRAWDRVGKIAKLMVDGAPRQLTGGATHYHTKAVRPKWSRVFSLTTTIGAHKFYTMERRVAG